MRTLISLAIIIWLGNATDIPDSWSLLVIMALIVAILQDLKELYS